MHMFNVLVHAKLQVPAPMHREEADEKSDRCVILGLETVTFHLQQSTISRYGNWVLQSQ